MIVKVQENLFKAYYRFKGNLIVPKYVLEPAIEETKRFLMTGGRMYGERLSYMEYRSMAKHNEIWFTDKNRVVMRILDIFLSDDEKGEYNVVIVFTLTGDNKKEIEDKLAYGSLGILPSMIVKKNEADPRACSFIRIVRFDLVTRAILHNRETENVKEMEETKE